MFGGQMSIIYELILPLIRTIPDYPEPGVMFKDITPILENSIAFSTIIHKLGKRYSDPDFRSIDKIAAIESRGFIFGAALAFYLRVGLVLLRKKGKLPRKTISRTYKSEYRTDTLEIHTDSIKTGEDVILIDDALATGKSAIAASELIEELEGNVVECAFPFELDGLGGRKELEDNGYHVHSLMLLPKE